MIKYGINLESKLATRDYPDETLLAISTLDSLFPKYDKPIRNFFAHINTVITYTPYTGWSMKVEDRFYSQMVDWINIYLRWEFVLLPVRMQGSPCLQIAKGEYFDAIAYRRESIDSIADKLRDYLFRTFRRDPNVLLVRSPHFINWERFDEWNADVSS